MICASSIFQGKKLSISWKPPSPEPSHVAVATCSQLQPLEKFLTENPTCHLMDGCLSADI